MKQANAVESFISILMIIINNSQRKTLKGKTDMVENNIECGQPLLKGYRLEIFRSKCRPSDQTMMCHAHLDQNIGKAIPYLNAEWEADSFIADPPSVTLKWHGRLVTVYEDKIAVNVMAGKEEAAKMIELLKMEINEIWDRRNEIAPVYTSKPVPRIMDVLKKLPRTNCGKCGQPTCVVFGSLLIQGAVEISGCPDLDDREKEQIAGYLSKGYFSR